MTAFGLVPRVPPFTVVTPAHILKTFHTLARHAGLHQLRAEELFYSGPCLGRIREGNSRTGAFSVVADQHRRFVIQSVGALHGIVVLQIRAIVVAANGREGFTNMFRVEQRPEAGHVGLILSDQLIRETTIAELEIRMLGIFGAAGPPKAFRDLPLGNTSPFLDLPSPINPLPTHPLPPAPPTPPHLPP